jgi:DNA-binding NtrC family response regulator
LSAMKLLVVDKDPGIVKYMDALLTHWGYQVVSLCFLGEQTAADVFEQVRLQKFDVALVDFWMPSMLGTELPTQIKRLSPTTKIVIMSLMPVPPAAADALRRKGVDFGEVLLPFEEKELICAGVFCVPRN